MYSRNEKARGVVTMENERCSRPTLSSELKD